MQALQRQSRRALASGGVSHELWQSTCSRLGICSFASVGSESNYATGSVPFRQAAACLGSTSEQVPCSSMLLQPRRTFFSSSICLEARRKQDQNSQDVVHQDERYSSITDKIPVRPVSAPEAAGWSLFILLAYAITAALAYFVVTQLFMEQPEVGAFNTALDKVRQDPRITVQLGETIKGYGNEGGRASRHRISHRIYSDDAGQQHVQVQFHIAGNGQRGIVSADMYQSGGVWQYSYLYVDVSGRRVVLIEPRFQY